MFLLEINGGVKKWGKNVRKRENMCNKRGNYTEWETVNNKGESKKRKNKGTKILGENEVMFRRMYCNKIKIM